MQYYFAPLEGVTDRIYRRLHHRYFPGVDRYYTPFFSPTVHRALTPRESLELPPAESWGFPTVPQMLTKVPADFCWMAQVCKDLGYSEVNLNLGCPSGTVTAKGKGAGMLRDPEELTRFLDGIFENAPLPISVKTRLGFEKPEEFSTILDILNRYPIAELTVHPRVRTDFYKGKVNMAAFAYGVENSQVKLCFNGNLCSRADIEAFSRQFPTVTAVMLGRGLIGDPGMLTPGGTTISALEPFLEELLEEYTANFGGARNAMFRLKENWRYLLRRFEADPRLEKKLRKTTDVAEYRQIVAQILHDCPLLPCLEPDW